jgi:hypothetical protein
VLNCAHFLSSAKLILPLSTEEEPDIYNYIEIY